MSQAGTTNGGGGGTIEGILEIDTQHGNMAPVANIGLFKAYDTTENNLYGLVTKGNTFSGFPAETGVGETNEFDVYLTNRFHSETTPGVAGPVTTTDATPTIIASCPMATNPAVFKFEVDMVALDTTNTLGATIKAQVSFRTNGGSPVILTSDDFVIQEDADFNGTVIFGGSSTLFTVTVTGVAATTIKWLCHGTYTVVS